MTKEEILSLAQEQDGFDERETTIDEQSDSNALEVSLALCVALAAIKIFCFHENPYDIFAIQYLALAAKKQNDWKKLHRIKDLYLAVILWLTGCFCLLAYLIWSIAKRGRHEEE